jgi:hypothetical protein
MALPPPDRVTFGTGQPKFMSRWSTPESARLRAISPASCGSEAYICTLRGASSGRESAKSRVRRLPRK